MAKQLLTSTDIALLKRVATLSLAGSLAIVVIVYGIQRLRLRPVERSVAVSTKSLFSAGHQLENIDYDAHACAAEHYLSLQQPHRAVGHLQRMLQMRRGVRNVEVKLATALIAAGAYAQARDRLQELLDDRSRDSLSPAISARYGLCLFHTGQTQKSLEHLRRCMEQYPDNPEAALYLGQALAALDTTPAEAQRWFETALRLRPAYVEARYQQARHFMTRKEYVKGRDSLLRILEFEPLHARTHARLGMVYYYLNQLEMSIKFSQTALALNPDDFNTRYNLGEAILLSGKESARALAEFKKVLALNPGHVEANFKAGVICASGGMTKEAVGFLEKAVESGGRNPRVLLQLAAAYERLGMSDNALQTYRAVLDLDRLDRIALQKVRQLEAERTGRL